MMKNILKTTIFIILINLIFIFLLFRNYEFIISNLVVYISIGSFFMLFSLVLLLFLFNKDSKILQKRILYISLLVTFLISSTFIFIFCNLVQNQTIIFSSDFITILNIWTDKELEVFMLNYSLEKQIDVNNELGTYILTMNKTPEEIKTAVDFIEFEQNKIKKNEEFSYIKYITEFCKKHIVAIAVIGTIGTVSTLGLCYYFGFFDSFLTALLPATVEQVLTAESVFEQHTANVLCSEADYRPLTEEGKALLFSEIARYRPLEAMIIEHLKSGKDLHFNEADSALVKRMEDLKENIRTLITQTKGALAEAKAAGKHLPLGISDRILNYHISQTNVERLRSFLFRVNDLPLPVRAPSVIPVDLPAPAPAPAPVPSVIPVDSNVPTPTFTKPLSAKSIARLAQEGITEEVFWRCYPGMTPMEVVTKLRYEREFINVLDTALKKKK